jgi:hypothetical protein
MDAVILEGAKKRMREGERESGRERRGGERGREREEGWRGGGRC